MLLGVLPPALDKFRERRRATPSTFRRRHLPARRAPAVARRCDGASMHPKKWTRLIVTSVEGWIP